MKSKQKGPPAETFSGGFLFVRHFAGQMENEPAIGLFDFAKEAAEFFQKESVVAGTAPGVLVWRLPDAECGGIRRLIAFVEKLVHRHFERLRPLLQGLDGGDGVAILDAREIRAKKAGAGLDFALRQFLFHAQLPESLTNNHQRIITLSQ